MPTRQNVGKRASGSDLLSMPTHQTGPLASPHRAGHYSGLHPEDQPYQSSFFWRIERRPEQTPADISVDASTLLDAQADDAPDEQPYLWAEPEQPEQYAPVEQPPFWDGPKAEKWQTLEEQPPLWTEPAHQELLYPPVERHPSWAEPAYPDERREQLASARSALADIPTQQPWQRAPQTPIPPTPPNLMHKSAKKTRTVPFLFIASLICFLVATSLSTFLLVMKEQADKSHANKNHAATPQLLASPGELRIGDTLQLAGKGFTAHQTLVLTHDAQAPILNTQGKRLAPITDRDGNFDIEVPITPIWSVGVHALHVNTGVLTASTMLTVQAAPTGAPLLQLVTSHLDLGAGNPGTIAHENVTLTNAGGGQVNWTGQSSVSWLSLNPTRGSFFGNTTVALTVDRTNLAPQAYVGQVTFTQNGDTPQILHITMTVNTLPANLNLSTASLAFASTFSQNPPGQTLVLQNSGGQSLDWTGGSTTSDGGSWLSMSPSSGILGANTAAVLTVNVTPGNMAPGTYQGALSFSYANGSALQTAITLTIAPTPQPAMQIAPQSLSFTSNQGTNPVPKSFTITDTGNAPLNWAITADANGKQYLVIAPVKGSIAPGQSTNVSIAPLLGNANGTINSTLSIGDSDPGTTVHSQQVTINMAIASQPGISVTTGTIQFNNGKSPTKITNPLTFSNSGSVILSWKVVESTQAPWLTFDATSGTLAPGASVSLQLTCNSSGLQPGTYTVTLTLENTDASAVVPPQKVTVTLIVS